LFSSRMVLFSFLIIFHILSSIVIYLKFSSSLDFYHPTSYFGLKWCDVNYPSLSEGA